jgi:hypothetical protein
MIRQIIFSHYRIVSEAVVTVVTFGTALLLGFLILEARLSL